MMLEIIFEQNFLFKQTGKYFLFRVTTLETLEFVDFTQTNRDGVDKLGSNKSR